MLQNIFVGLAREGKRNDFETHQNTAILNKAQPSGDTTWQSLKCWGVIRA